MPDLGLGRESWTYRANARARAGDEHGFADEAGGVEYRHVATLKANWVCLVVVGGSRCTPRKRCGRLVAYRQRMSGYGVRTGPATRGHSLGRNGEPAEAAQL